MVNTQMASARILSFPRTQQKPDLAANNLIHRIMDSKDNLLTALEVLRDSYNMILAGTSLRDADEILVQAEAALQQAANVMANAEETTTTIKNLQATSHKQLLLFPPSNRAGV
jgi:precorrin-6B methylase 2